MHVLKRNLKRKIETKIDQKVEEIPKNSSPYTLMAGETENGSPAEILVKMDQKPSKQNVTGKRLKNSKYFELWGHSQTT